MGMLTFLFCLVQLFSVQGGPPQNPESARARKEPHCKNEDHPAIFTPPIYVLTMEDATKREKELLDRLRVAIADSLDISLYRVRLRFPDDFEDGNGPIKFTFCILDDFCSVDASGLRSGTIAYNKLNDMVDLNDTKWKDSALYQENLYSKLIDNSKGLPQKKQLDPEHDKFIICYELPEPFDFHMDASCPDSMTRAPAPEPDKNYTRKLAATALISVQTLIFVSAFWVWWSRFEQKEDEAAELHRKSVTFDMGNRSGEGVSKLMTQKTRRTKRHQARDVVKKGVLEKQGPKPSAFAWRERYFVLVGTHLRYSDNRSFYENGDENGVIELYEDTKVEKAEESLWERDLVIQISNPKVKNGRVYYLSCDSEKELDAWISVFNEQKALAHVVKEGVMEKQGSKPTNKGWKNRYFVLSGNSLSYSKSKQQQETGKNAGVVHLDMDSMVTLADNPMFGRDHVVLISSNNPRNDKHGGSYMFACSDHETAEEWTIALQDQLVVKKRKEMKRTASRRGTKSRKRGSVSKSKKRRHKRKKDQENAHLLGEEKKNSNSSDPEASGRISITVNTSDVDDALSPMTSPKSAAMTTNPIESSRKNHGTVKFSSAVSAKEAAKHLRQKVKSKRNRSRTTGSMSPRATIKSGWLKRKNEKKETWEKRYFSLSGTARIRYFKTTDVSEKSAGSWGVLGSKLFSYESEDGEFVFGCEYKDRLHMLMADTEEMRQEWLDALVQAGAQPAQFVKIDEQGESGSDSEARETAKEETDTEAKKIARMSSESDGLDG